MQRRDFLALSAAVCCSPAWSLDWSPRGPLTLVVASPPGGGTDFSARLVADGLARALGQTVAVDNSKAGGAGSFGALFVKDSDPDGQTLLVNYNGYHVVTPHLYKDRRWDPLSDFVGVAMLTRGPQLMVVSSRIPAGNLRELAAYANKNPGRLSYASVGAGSMLHIAGELFKRRLGVQAELIEYRGTGSAVLALLAGQVDMMFTSPPSVAAHVKSGKLKALAVTGKQRMAMLPKVPTAAEQGMDWLDLDSWFALFAPARTPASAVDRLNREVNAQLSQPEVQQRAFDFGVLAEPWTPQRLNTFVISEFDRWGRIIRDAGIKLD